MNPPLDLYAPATAALSATLAAAICPAAAAAQVQRPIRCALLRVSDENRSKFLKNLDSDLDWLTWAPEAQWVKANVTNVEMFRATAAGEHARAGIDMHALHAPGSNRLIGGWLVRGSWVFMFLLTSAAKADLPRGANAATEAIKALLLATAHADPHDLLSRTILYAHALDRILRTEKFSWEVFDTLTQTYVRVDAAGRTFDALVPNAKDEWTLITFGAARGRDDTARRFLVARLNKARAGNWPGNESGLPTGFCGSTDPDEHGKFNLNPTLEQRHVSRPIPDPRARWAVQTIADVYADPAITSWAAAAAECGRRGITARGIDERGTSLADVSDLTSAGRLLLTPVKIRAYLIGKLSHTETGVTPGQFSPGDGHRLQPRYPGDPFGAATHDIHVGVPEDDGWSWDVLTQRWTHILRKWWLPADFQPHGWVWDDHPMAWGWEQILQACERPKKQRTGRHAANPRQRPFSGLLRWENAAQRHLVFCRGRGESDTSERYEWRTESLADARRNPATGVPYRMRSTDGAAMSSWTVTEFHAEWAALAQKLLEQLLAGNPELLEQRLNPSPSTALDTVGVDEVQAHRRRCADLRNKAAEHRSNASSLRLSAAHHRNKGNEKAADRYDVDAERVDASADQADRDAAALEADPPAPRPPAVEVADFGTPVAVIAALTGAYAAGSAPVALQEALREMGAGQTRLEVINATTIKLTITVQVRRPDGTLLTNTGHSVLRRTRPNLKGERASARRLDAKHELARAWFLDGIDLATLIKRAGASEHHSLRIVREFLATGTTRSVGQAEMEQLAADRIPIQALRAAITTHKVHEARAAVWCSLNPGTPLPERHDPSFADHVARTYRSGDAAWGRGTAMYDPRSDHRLDTVTVLRALPEPTRPIRADHLAEMMGIANRHIHLTSTELRRGNLTIPASLTRSRNWTDARSTKVVGPEDRTVALPACPWPDCETPTADALVLLPEVVIGCHSSTICRDCLRPPTMNIRFPTAYRNVINELPVRAGTWVHCAAQCDTDLGAGHGLLWRWNDTPPQHRSAHPTCAGGKPEDLNARIRAWAANSGIPLGNYGRIPAPLRRQFTEA